MGPEANEKANSSKRQHFAKVDRQVVLHRIATADSLEDRLFWAMILWSWCGPDVSPMVVQKDEDGWIVRDKKRNATPATLQDLLEDVLGLASGMKSHVSEAAKRLELKNSVRFEGRLMYPEREPAPLNPLDPDSKVPVSRNFVIGSSPPKVPVSRNFVIGSRVVHQANLPVDPEARDRAIQWLEKASQAYLEDLRECRSRHTKFLDTAIPSLGILYRRDKSLRDRAAAAAKATSSSEEPSNGFAAAAAVSSSSTSPKAPEIPSSPPSTALVAVPIPLDERQAPVDLKDYPQMVHKVRKELGLERTPDSILHEMVAGVRAKALKHGIRPADVALAVSDETLCKFLDGLEKPKKSAWLYVRLNDGRDGTLLEWADIVFAEAAANGGRFESPPPSAQWSPAMRVAYENLKRKYPNGFDPRRDT